MHLEALSLKGGCTGSSESTLVIMPNCSDHVSRLIYMQHACQIANNSKLAVACTKVDYCTAMPIVYIHVDASKVFAVRAMGQTNLCMRVYGGLKVSMSQRAVPF